MEMKSASSSSSSSFPANYVTLKDLQEKWIKRKQDEENEANLRIQRKQREENEANLRRQRKQREENEANLRKLQQQQLIQSYNEKKAKNHQNKSKRPIRSTAKSEKKRGSGSTVKISDKREEKRERGDRTAEICRRVADLSVAGGDDRRSGRVEVVRGYRGRRGGDRPAVMGSRSGMVWVRKTIEG